MKQPIILFFVVFIITFSALMFFTYSPFHVFGSYFWNIRSIDTMKYSRDLAREKLDDPQFDAVIDMQVRNIALTGANYVAIGTPYDEEFLPILKRWVKAARKYHLHVWFRGNFSGWEGWFGYEQIDRATHIAKTKVFIFNNTDLFEDGDIFSSCPECENGAKSNFGDSDVVQEYRAFLIEEYRISKDAFIQIDKNVQSNYFSMNGDVAKLVMDISTTTTLDGIVVVDHYVEDPKIFAEDLRELAKQSGGQIVLGEFGAPIPDIHGKMNDEKQKLWLEEVLNEIRRVDHVVGVNYWVNTGGSTALWTGAGKAKPAVESITKFYSHYMLFEY